MPLRPRYADLLQTIKDPDPRRADKAYDSILFDRGEALPDLVQAYTVYNADAVLRFYIVQLMGFSEDPRAIPPVVQALSDSSADVRAEACRALEDLRARDSLPQLHARLEDMDAKVRLAAEETIRALGGWRT
jgi:HEAT repeat protein